MNWLYEYFKFKDRILLSFSGGKGKFDYLFICNYLKRHKINGFEELKFENIKSKISSAPLGCEGQLSKDNLCRMFGIEGVSKVHSSYNDCILEWKLYEKLASECVFFIQNSLYKYTPEYIIPVSYLSKHPDLIKFANITIPHIVGKATEVKRLSFPKEVLKEIKKFPTNITGITVEHGINTYLKAEEQNNFMFLTQNKSHLKYVGSLDSSIKEIPIITEDDGTVKAIRTEDEEYINSVNNVTKIMIEYIEPMAEFLRKNIFKDEKIMTQEISISENRKVLALCDLSDSSSVVKIKTNSVIENNGLVISPLAKQLYYQSKGRNTYILSIQFDTHYDYESTVDDLNVILYDVDLTTCDPSPIERIRVLKKIEINILKELEKNNKIPKTELSRKIKCSYKGVGFYLNALEKFQYIKKENEFSRKKTWIILRGSDDITTKYKVVDDKIVFIKD